jgi:biopolymer transport protein ExbB
MLQLIQKGGPIMWPLMITSIISVSVILERIYFIVTNAMSRDPKAVVEIYSNLERGNVPAAVLAGENSKDFVAKVLVEGLKQPEKFRGDALLQASNRELQHFNSGLTLLDTVITLAPLLGLLATVTGMIHAFGLLGGRELDSPTVITGGIAESLIGTAFGLGIAVMALIPFNYLNSLLEKARHELQDAATRLDLILKRLNS